MVFGSIFSKFDSVDLTTADGVRIHFKNTPLSKIAFKIIGLPHLGIRMRAGKIIPNSPKRINKMLDAGCGTGIYSFTLAERADSVESIDISREKINQIKKVNPLRNINFQVGDLTKLKFKSNLFDLIVCSDVIEHIKSDKKAFFELARVLKPSGTLLLTLPSDSEFNRKTYKKYEHERPGYSKEKIEELCKTHNLLLEKSEGYSYPFTEKLFKLNEKLFKSNFLLGILFYPLYLSAIFSEKFFNKKEPNGIFFKIKKI